MRTTMAVLLAAVATTPLAFGAPAAKDEGPCFFTQQFVSWKAPDTKTIYISVRPEHVYKLDLATSCPSLLRLNARLHTKWRSDSVCSHSDWDLKVSQGPGSPAVPCIVKSMTKLSAVDAKAIPDQFRPAF